MSSQAATVSRDAIQAMLDAIMCRLDNIELKLEPLHPIVFKASLKCRLSDA
jgi:hypothetical protein